MISKFLNNYFSFKIIVFLSILIYGITAYNSNGFYHADEHYQIIEFAGIKLGTHNSNELAWEYQAKIRSTLQPTICYLIFSFLKFINISNPYIQAFILRLCTAFFAIWAIGFFIKKTEFQFKNYKVFYRLLSYFLWFIPVLSVRFSSETLSGLFFLIGLGIFYGKSKNKFYIIGILFGISFLFRFQIAFAILGFLLWLVFIHNEKWLELFKILTFSFIVLILGIICDSWFYDKFVFTSWNYFQMAIGLDVVPSNFGESHWSYYLKKMITAPTYIFGIFFCLSFLIVIIYKSKNIFIWCISIFIIFHSLVPHKEIRFLFPIVFLIPNILLTSYLVFKEKVRNHYLITIVNTLSIIVFLGVNLIGLVAMGTKSAGYGRTEITKYIHDRYKNKSIHLIHCRYSNPYNPWGLLPMKFYLETDISSIQIQNICEISDSLFLDNKITFIVIRKYDLDKVECIETLEKYFEYQTQSIPKWIEKINIPFNIINNKDILILYKQKY